MKDSEEDQSKPKYIDPYIFACICRYMREIIKRCCSEFFFKISE